MNKLRKQVEDTIEKALFPEGGFDPDLPDELITLIRTATLEDDVESVIFSLRDYKGFRHWHDDVDQDDVKQHAIDNLRGKSDE